MIFEGAETTGFEEDARLTAMWLWTLSTGANGAKDASDSQDEEDNTDDDEAGSKTAAKSGYTLEYDAARKIAQGLGEHLEQLTSVVEVKGEKARLLSVAERTRNLFGKDEASAPTKARKKKAAQKMLFEPLDEVEDEQGGWGEKSVPTLGKTVLDRIHQSMILFAAGAARPSRGSSSKTASGEMHAIGGWPRPSRHFIRPARTKSAGWMAFWPGRRAWGSSVSVRPMM